MTKIETLRNKSGESIYPLTSTKAVVDENGNTIEDRLVVADGEDLVTDGNVLRLKDRPNTDGMGYVILRKDKTFAEQVTKPNTIYEIRYDFDLGRQELPVVLDTPFVLPRTGGAYYRTGDHINVEAGMTVDLPSGGVLFDSTLSTLIPAPYTPSSKKSLYVGKLQSEAALGQSCVYSLEKEVVIPENCVLKFEGGSLGNGTVVLNRTQILNKNNYKIFEDSLNIKGLSNVLVVYPEWWGAKGDGSADDTQAFRKANQYLMTTLNRYVSLFLHPGKRYRIEGDRIIGSNKDSLYVPELSPRIYSIQGNHAVIDWKPYDEQSILFNLNSEIGRFDISDCYIYGTNENTKGTVFNLSHADEGWSNANNSYTDIKIIGSTNGGFHKIYNIEGSVQNDLANIQNCHFENFEYCLYSKNRNAVSWVFNRCNFITVLNPSAKIFYFEEMDDSFVVSNSSFSISDGNTIIHTAKETANNGFNFVLENNRFECFYAQGATEPRDKIKVISGFGHLTIKNCGFLAGRFYQQPMEFKTEGLGRITIENSSLPAHTEFLLNEYDSRFDGMGLWTQMGIRIINSNVNLNSINIIRKDGSVVSYYDAIKGGINFKNLYARDCFLSGEYKSCVSLDVCNDYSLTNGRELHKLIYSKNDSNNNPTFIKMPPYQAIVSVDLLLDGIPQGGYGNSVIMYYGNEEHVIEKPIYYNSHFNTISLFKGLAFTKNPDLHKIKWLIKKKNGDTYTYGGLLVVTYVSAFRYGCIDKISDYDEILFSTNSYGSLYPGEEIPTEVAPNEFLIDTYARRLYIGNTNGTAAFEYDGEAPRILRSGTTKDKPNNVANKGFQYFDTTLNKPIWWNGTEWVGPDSHAVDIQRAGTWAQRPNADGSYLENGFQYFLLESEPDEDPEGNPIESITGNGKPIWWIQDGSKWVDATGATVTG